MNQLEKELAAAIEFEAPHWHVVVLRWDGKLKVRKNLTRDQAREAVRELAPNQRPKTFSMQPNVGGGFGPVKKVGPKPSAQDAVEVHVLGPQGAVLHCWADVEPPHQDLT